MPKLALENVRHATPIKINFPVGAASGESTLTKLQRQQMLNEVVLRVYEKKFVSFVNGLFEHGIVCSDRAKALGIKQVSSLDQHPRAPTEVEVNFIADMTGLGSAIGIASRGKGSGAAKGALSIALERFRDPLPSTLEPGKLDEAEEKKVRTLAPFESIMRKQLLEQKGPQFTDESLEILANRTESCVLILSIPKKISLFDNNNKPLSVESSVSKDFLEECKTDSIDSCREVKIQANISPKSFDLVLIPKRFEHLASKFKKPENCEICFVESNMQRVSYNYPPQDPSDTRTIATNIIEVRSPNFSTVAANYLKENNGIVSHLSKGTALNEL